MSHHADVPAPPPQERLGELSTLVPLGARVLAPAVVPDTRRAYVHVGLGFSPELSLDEARAAAALRREHLQRQADARAGEVVSVRAHLRLVEQALGDLAALQQQAA